MAHDRRQFIRLGISGTAALLAGCSAVEEEERGQAPAPPAKGPLVLATWNHGLPATTKALAVLVAGGSVLDAVEQGCAMVESDFGNRSVGLGGMPDRDGFVTLDACIQNHDGRAGAVAFLQGFEHPVSVARAILERTPHLMLVGSGAERWALENGFTQRVVDIPEVRAAWQEWLATGTYRPVPNSENTPLHGGAHQHDTIGMVAMDAAGRLAGGCTTSGLAYKVHGRVGDSPIIGAGLFVDGDVGAATATGLGEVVMRSVASHAVVERMRQGMEPQAACKAVVQHILRKEPGLQGQQVGLLALRKDGLAGAWSIYEGFDHALGHAGGVQLVKAGFERKW
jgi:N4-(beta-N-acetylglucosaminyl)-L-asparaginase